MGSIINFIENQIGSLIAGTVCPGVPKPWGIVLQQYQVLLTQIEP